jgi:hypothetical protein
LTGPGGYNVTQTTDATGKTTFLTTVAGTYTWTITAAGFSSVTNYGAASCGASAPGNVFPITATLTPASGYKCTVCCPQPISAAPAGTATIGSVSAALSFVDDGLGDLTLEGSAALAYSGALHACGKNYGTGPFTLKFIYGLKPDGDLGTCNLRLELYDSTGLLQASCGPGGAIGISSFSCSPYSFVFGPLFDCHLYGAPSLCVPGSYGDCFCSIGYLLGAPVWVDSTTTGLYGSVTITP